MNKLVTAVMALAMAMTAQVASAATSFSFSFSGTTGSNQTLEGSGVFFTDDGVDGVDADTGQAFRVYGITGGTGTVSVGGVLTYTLDGSLGTVGGDLALNQLVTFDDSAALLEVALGLTNSNAPLVLSLADVGYFISVGDLIATAGDVTVTAVPEPATWALLILGFGLVGGAMRRRRAAAFA
ncbi:hypothetical protein GCM10011380_07240 [Sphingomonas metalli]|uniref:Ice-binding protein C-terminal domain-containing protein n=1 Tax=Sphingomonas metalli TaxID=1779358 RepID=A0A916WNT7_9SPHN|nr:PEPxxWA-CTERM sorting domain-containing protein [Sphingomonas metalli]GGB20210.1 hypothetical protein GCM10011380_07240 [Sphingomonas metalli]